MIVPLVPHPCLCGYFSILATLIGVMLSYCSFNVHFPKDMCFFLTPVLVKTVFMSVYICQGLSNYKFHHG